MKRKECASRIAQAMFVLIVLFAANMSFTDDAWVTFATTPANSLVVVIACCLLLKQGFLGNESRFSLTVALPSLFFALATVVGMALADASTLCIHGVQFQSGTGETVLTNRFVLVVALFGMFVGYLLLYYAIVEWLYGLVVGSKAARLGNDEDKPASKGWFSLDHLLTFRGCVIVLLVAWLPYFVYYFPTTFTSDTSRSLAQLFGTGGLLLDDHFPYLTILLYGGLYRLGCLVDPSGYLGVLLMNVLQAALGALVFSLVVVWARRIGAPRWLAAATLAFFALFPLVPVYMVSAGKDTLHAELLVLFTLQVILFCISRRRDIPRSWIYAPWALFAVALLVALTRNDGIFLVAATFVVLLVAYREKLVLVAGGALLVCFGVWQWALLPLFGVESAGSAEALSLPAQIVASQLSEGNVTSEDDLAVLEQCFSADLEAVVAAYNPIISDPVKALISFDDESSAVSLATVAAHLIVEHPLSSTTAALKTTLSWYPFWYGTYYTEDVPYFCLPGDTWAFPEWFASCDDLPDLASGVKAGDRVLLSLHYLPLLSLLYAPGTYAWLLVFVLGLSFFAKSRRKLVVSALAAPLMLELVMVAAPCASVRYALPLVYSLPLFALLVYVVAQGAQERDGACVGDTNAEMVIVREEQ